MSMPVIIQSLLTHVPKKYKHENRPIDGSTSLFKIARPIQLGPILEEHRLY